MSHEERRALTRNKLGITIITKFNTSESKEIEHVTLKRITVPRNRLSKRKM